MYSWATPTAACTIFMCIAITNGETYDATNLQNQVPKGPKANPEADVCLTPQCIYAAARILTRMNSEVHPCNDFYEFVCGNYAQSAVIPDGSPMINQSYEKELETMSRLQRLIEDIDESKAPAAFSDLKKTYNKCIADELSTRDEPPDEEWHGNMIRIKNLWYMLARDNWISPEFDASAVGGLIFRFDPKPSVRNHSIEVLELAIDDTAIPWSFLRGKSYDMVQAYHTYLNNVAFHLSEDESRETRVAEDLPQILSFEMLLSDTLFPEEDIHKNSFEYHVTTVGDLDKKYPSWQLKQRIIEVHDVDVVEIPFDLKILDNLQRVIAEREGSRNFDAWVTWRLTDLESDRLDRFVADEKKKLHNTMFGTLATESLSKKCVERVRSKFSFLLNVLYYGQYMNDIAVKRSVQMLHNVRLQYLKFINEAEWLDFQTKHHAMEKIKAMTGDIGIFEKFMLDKNVDEPKSGLPKLSDGFLAHNRANLTKILLHTNPSREERHNFIKSHARYNYESQRMNVGGVSYTDAYYDVDRPEALNYGAFGYVVGSEIAYSFDEKGRHFDKNGKFESWWDSKNDAIFGKRSKCLVQQYNRYAFNEFGLILDYVKPRNEDIANNVGARAAYFAYDQWAENKAPEKRLPGLSYSPRQLFWISLAASQCTRYRPEFLKHGSLEDEHTLAKVRVNVALSNLPEFSNDFQCHIATNMDPEEKCVLW